MGRDKKNKPRRPRPERATTETRSWNYSPARILLLGEDLTDQERQAFTDHRWQTVDASDRGEFSSVRETAAKAGQSIEEAARSLVLLEDNKFLHWDGDRYLMIQPDDKA